MADDIHGMAPSGRMRLWASRIKGRRAMLVTAVLVLAGLSAFGQATLPAVAIAALVSLGAAILVPKSTDRLPRVVASSQADPLADGHLPLFADALGDPCLVVSQRGIVLHGNPAAGAQFSTTREGDPLTLSLRSPALRTAIDAALKTDISQTVELHQTVPNETWHKVVIAPLVLPRGRPGDPRLLLVTLQNLTEQKRVDAMRADFVANASHELRTPLTSLIGFIDTLLGPAAKDAVAREKFLGIMRAQAERMSKLIDDLLSLGRIEMRQHLRPTGTVDLAALLREVGEGLKVLADEADVALDIATPPEPVTVTGDHDELYEVFENLIDNAIKYGGDGKTVDIALRAVQDPLGYDYAISVADKGAGVAPEHVPRLTERFYRVDAGASRKKKGTGLGLAIVKHIVARHRGSMTIRSQRGEGTKVEVLLPK